MEPLPPKPAELRADEWMLVLAYRRCCIRRQDIIRGFANSMAGEDDQPDADVIAFPSESVRGER